MNKKNIFFMLSLLCTTITPQINAGVLDYLDKHSGTVAFVSGAATAILGARALNHALKHGLGYKNLDPDGTETQNIIQQHEKSQKVWNIAACVAGLITTIYGFKYLYNNGYMGNNTDGLFLKGNIGKEGISASQSERYLNGVFEYKLNVKKNDDPEHVDVSLVIKGAKETVMPLLGTLSSLVTQEMQTAPEASSITKEAIIQQMQECFDRAQTLGLESSLTIK